MSPKTLTVNRFALALAGVFATVTGIAYAQQLSVQEQALAVKATLAASQQSLRQYEWIETTVVRFRGEERSRQQNRCYHGADGKVQKVPVTVPAPPEQRRGVRGRIAEAKKEKLTDHMQQAVALVHQYVPPDPARLEAARLAGRVAIQPIPPGQRARLTFTDYLKPGDSLSVEIDLATNRILALRVASYLDSRGDAITLDVGFGTLVDGATYPATAALQAPGQQVEVSVENSGYRKM